MLYKSFSVFIGLTIILTACGGGGGDGVNPQFEKQYYYVDGSGVCDGQDPCYTTIDDALRDSFLSQFNEFLQAKRPNAPADQIVVMPGIYYSADPSDYVLAAGILRENYPDDNWKLEIIAEQGPDQTFITGLGVGPCIYLVDHLDLTISGFTITNCYEYQTSVINEDYAIFIQSYYNVDINIENNVFEDNASESAAIAISPYFVNFTNLNVRISGNTFRNNQGSIFLRGFPINPGPSYTSNILIDNNIIYSNQSGIWIGNFTEAGDNIAVNVVYNTIVNNLNTGLAIQQTKGINLHNNIVFGNATDIRGDELYNNISNNIVGEISQLNATDNLVGDPLLIDISSGNFTPTSSSSVIDNAMQIIPNIIEFDVLGNPRVIDGDGDTIALPDIGAIELQ